MDLINTNRLRLSARTYRRDWAEEPRLFRVTSWKSRDHDRPRHETTVVVETAGLVLSGKWRPDGKAPPSGGGDV